eukprot:scaffold242173_cov19-Tisochrysis_lutea.AAC.1
MALGSQTMAPGSQKMAQGSQTMAQGSRFYQDGCKELDKKDAGFQKAQCLVRTERHGGGDDGKTEWAQAPQSPPNQYKESDEKGRYIGTRTPKSLPSVTEGKPTSADQCQQ